MANPIIKIALGKAMKSDALKLDEGAEQPLEMCVCPKCGYEGPYEDFHMEDSAEESDEY